MGGPVKKTMVEYASLALPPGFEAEYQDQEGEPIDGGSEIFRDMSPYTIRIALPDALTKYVNTRGPRDASPEIFSGNTTSMGPQRTNSSLYLSATPSASNFVSQGQFMDIAGKALNEPMIMNRAAAADLLIQVQKILNTPPLTLLVNPQTMAISYTKIQSYGSRSRKNYIYQTWGEEQPTITFSGSTGGFYAGAANRSNQSNISTDGTTSSVTGLQYFSKLDSAAWQNFMSLFLFYRNNGYLYDLLNKTEAHTFIGSVVIDWDQWTYKGHFSSFTITYDEMMPNRVTFDAGFTVSEMIDNAQSPTVVLPQRAPTPSLSDPSWAPAGGFTSNARGLNPSTSRRVETVELSQSSIDLNLGI